LINFITTVMITIIIHIIFLLTIVHIVYLIIHMISIHG
jgi:hypothetical protein